MAARKNAEATAELVVRPMRLGDLREVLAIERVSFPTPWSERAFRGELTANSYADYIVAEQDGGVVGYAGMWIIFEEAHVTNIAVDPALRRRGVGCKLLEGLLRRAARRGCDRVTLEVRTSNGAAQRLYGRYGFRASGVRRGYYTDTNEDAVIMWKHGLRRQYRGAR